MLSGHPEHDANYRNFLFLLYHKQRKPIECLVYHLPGLYMQGSFEKFVLLYPLLGGLFE